MFITNKYNDVVVNNVSTIQNHFKIERREGWVWTSYLTKEKTTYNLRSHSNSHDLASRTLGKKNVKASS